MAYRQLFTGIKQTAYNVAGSVVAAEIAAGIVQANEVQSRLLEIADLLFEDLSQVVESDNKILEAEDAKEPAKPRSSGSGNWQNKPRSGGGSRSITADSARETTLNFGAFKGLTLGEVFDMSADDAAAYGYGDGKKTGKQYVTWLSKNEDNRFMQDRAKVLIEGARSQSDAA